jgi:hypothetical protein
MPVMAGGPRRDFQFRRSKASPRAMNATADVGAMSPGAVVP